MKSPNNGLLTYFKPRGRGLKRERPSVVQMNMKCGTIIVAFAAVAALAVADLELIIDLPYPRRIGLQFPVHEDSGFKVETTLDDSGFFAATGHVSRISGTATNRAVAVSLGYEYAFGTSKGSGTGTSSNRLDIKWSGRLLPHTIPSGPRFAVREVASPLTRYTVITNMAVFTNVATTVSSNRIHTAAQQTPRGDRLKASPQE
jgi:hypothetical protein